MVFRGYVPNGNTTIERYAWGMYYNKKNIAEACKDIYKENGFRCFYKGYLSTVIGLTPFIAINLSTYDILNNRIFYNTSIIGSFGVGGLAGIISQTICYPLDTIRRRMQIRENKNLRIVVKKIIEKEGFKSFYKGMMPNIVKIVPNNAIRFAIFEYLKKNFDEF